jgi:two-component system, cell cycle sensor histidine kinase and response regulator CckA
MRPENWHLARKDERAQRPERVGTSTRDIAHEFNNVLNSILMSAKLLQVGRPEDEQQHLLKVLVASAQRGAEMVKGLLAVPVH